MRSPSRSAASPCGSTATLSQRSPGSRRTAHPAADGTRSGRSWDAHGSPTSSDGCVGLVPGFVKATRSGWTRAVGPGGNVRLEGTRYLRAQPTIGSQPPLSPATDTMAVMKLIEISELARRADVTTATIRHYDRRGLLPPTRRGPGGGRLYDAESVDRLMLIRRIRAAGLSLEETRGVLDALATSDVHPSFADPEMLEQRLQSVRAHLEHVRRVEQTLVDALERGRATRSRADLAAVPRDDAQRGSEG